MHCRYVVELLITGNWNKKKLRVNNKSSGCTLKIYKLPPQDVFFFIRSPPKKMFSHCQSSYGDNSGFIQTFFFSFLPPLHWISTEWNCITLKKKSCFQKLIISPQNHVLDNPQTSLSTVFTRAEEKRPFLLKKSWKTNTIYWENTVESHKRKFHTRPLYLRLEAEIS